ncbi:DUF2242 domain-containing protein [Herbaspirillum lusitanum]|uniref:DUF2242 domain-containing protein n=1 Tax=Herbaspirillum lusitanum TaxID=213312 RepID=A0ABW9A5D3_9BURK
MRRPHLAVQLLLSVTLAMTLSACTTNKKAFYHQEDFGDTPTFVRTFPSGEKSACEAARRALLGQGYVISKSENTVLDGAKSFQPEADKHIEISFHVVCAPDGKDGKNSSMFASATQDGFALKKTNGSASLGVSVLGSVSMPFMSSDDSLVRVTSETIRSGDFYDRFFGAVERYLVIDGDEPATAEQAKKKTGEAAGPPSK